MGEMPRRGPGSTDSSLGQHKKGVRGDIGEWGSGGRVQYGPTGAGDAKARREWGGLVCPSRLS